jgi:hypothetical protein
VAKIWQQMRCPDDGTGVRASSHDVPASSLEPTAPLSARNRDTIAVGGYSAQLVGSDAEPLFIPGPVSRARVSGVSPVCHPSVELCLRECMHACKISPCQLAQHQTCEGMQEPQHPEGLCI